MKTSEPLPVVLIHGLVGSLDDPAIAAALRPHLVLSPSLLGYGDNADVDPATITLAAQGEHVVHALRKNFGSGRVHLVGHSVGSVVAALLASNYPELVASLVSVEGNFTLKDAFWSASVGRMDLPEAEAMLNGFRSDPKAWLARSGVQPTEERVKIARRWLALQPASTLRAMGISVVDTTGAPSYEVLLRAVFARTPVHLIAGERTRAGWDVPPWAEKQSISCHVVPNAGHMMMLEDAEGFGRLVGGIIASSTQRITSSRAERA